MCGIVGFISKERRDSTVEKMLSVQAYRGPDDRGIFVEQIDDHTYSLWSMGSFTFLSAGKVMENLC